MFYVANNNLRTQSRIDKLGNSPSNPAAGMPSSQGQTTTLGESQPATPNEDILPQEFDQEKNQQKPREKVDLDQLNDCGPGPADNRH